MIAGRYSLDREIGRGGMGSVWLGRDEVLGRPVALKRIGMVPGAGAPDLVRAEREARLAARLNHPHVVSVFDLVVEDDQQWLVMEYVEGVTLAELVREEGPLPPDRAAALLAQAADALAEAHEAGIVHRDVKPSNILVTSHGQVKLTDFGIARAAADATLTQTGLVTGSPAYLAPEVASGQSATPASDVWSLGATLYHALAGKPPYEVGENLMGALYRIVHEEPPRLPEAGRLAPLLEATMTREPADRWPVSRVRDVLRSGGVAPEPARSSSDPPPGRTRALPATPPPTPGHPVQGRGPGRSLLPVLVGLVVVVLVVALLGWQLITRGNDGADPGAASPPTRSGTSGGSPSDGRTPSGSSSPSPGGPTADGMQQFIKDYLATVTRDQKSAFAMLTPRFQRASGGLFGYDGYWSTIRTADLRSFTGTDPDALTIGYVVDYTRKNGSSTTDRVSLQLVYRHGRYLIDGES